MPRNHDRGFTLIELLIVVAVIAILAMMAVPNLLSTRVTSNETVAIAALRSVVTAQLQCQMHAVVDTDGDGRGEALGLDEMCGTRLLRTGAELLNPPSLPPSLGIVDANGNVSSRGYLLRLYLPDASGTGLPATAGNAGSVDADLAEVYWSCVAWPQTRAASGNLAFYTNQTGDILSCIDSVYDGASNGPAAGAALNVASPDMLVGGTPAPGGTAADGRRWKIVR